MLIPVSSIAVPIPGTLVRVTTGQENPQEKFACHGALIQAFWSNTGRVYIGRSTMNKATKTDIIAVLAIPTDNTIPSFTAALTLSPNAINLSDLYLDVDVAGEGAIVSVLIA